MIAHKSGMGVDGNRDDKETKGKDPSIMTPKELIAFQEQDPLFTREFDPVTVSLDLKLDPGWRGQVQMSVDPRARKIKFSHRHDQISAAYRDVFDAMHGNGRVIEDEIVRRLVTPSSDIEHDEQVLISFRRIREGCQSPVALTEEVKRYAVELYERTKVVAKAIKELQSRKKPVEVSQIETALKRTPLGSDYRAFKGWGALGMTTHRLYSDS